MGYIAEPPQRENFLAANRQATRHKCKRGFIVVDSRRGFAAWIRVLYSPLDSRRVGPPLAACRFAIDRDRITRRLAAAHPFSAPLVLYMCLGWPIRTFSP